MALIEEKLLKDIAHKKDLLRAPDGDLDTIQGLANVKEALFRRLITTPGALLHRPDYGVGIKDFQNAVNKIDTQRALALRIKEQFERDTRIDSLEGVRFDTNDDRPERTLIFIRVKVKGFQEVTFPFVPFGGEGVS